ncbi:unnamed protein product [Effrenium voratum]|uniref:Uncharacterized protein n=1 Tax=Effrenium voratum TaxID=2562239 RepID=A0AA36HS14_9DINO|nr:unnamed protein product [Effrenium voratum]
MSLCLLVDGLGVSSLLRNAASHTWAKKGPSVQRAWLVRDSALQDLEHPGFTLVDGSQLWIHQPLLDPGSSDAKQRLQELESQWSPPAVWGDNETLILEGVTWQVLRRLRLLSAPELLKQDCDWFGYFRANSFVNTGAVVTVLQQLCQRRGWSMEMPLILGRGIVAEQHGVTMPALNWGSDMLEVIWASRGLLLNRAALNKISAMVARGRLPGGILQVTKMFIPNLRVLQTGLVYAFAGDSHMQGLVEFVFAAALRGHDQALRIRWMPEHSERFLEGELVLERFAFRLAAASFGWSRRDRNKAGLRGPKRGRSDPGLRLRKRSTTFWESCLGRMNCAASMLPQCVLVIHPMVSEEQMKDLHRLVPRVSCLAGPNLRLRGDSPVHNAFSAPTSAVSRDAWSSSWCRSVRRNRQIWSHLVSFSWSATHPHSATTQLVSSRGGTRKGWRPCPKLHFAPRLRPWDRPQPLALHGDEWVRGPAGQLRLRLPTMILLSLPNSGTTWIMTVLEEAQKNKGCVAGSSDILHPNCNGLLMKELSKVAGAPDHESWPNIFESPPAAAMDLLLELAIDQLHGKALTEVQQMRLSGFTTAGEELPSALVWPWKGWIPRGADVTRVGLVLTKEIINVYQVSNHLEMRHRSGLRPAVIAFALYRHRAHCFPMSNSSAALCKECWYQQILRAFEMANFAADYAMRGLQRFWRTKGRLVGGVAGPSGLIFAHLVAWFPLLRAQLFGLRVLDYVRLVTLGLGACCEAQALRLCHATFCPTAFRILKASWRSGSVHTSSSAPSPLLALPLRK